MKGLFCAPCQNLAYSQSPAFRPLIVCRICGWGSLCICACAYKIQRCDDKMQEYRKKNLFFPFMLVRHEVCVWFTSRQPCHTALKNSIWCERVFTLLLSDAQPWPSCPEYTQQLCDTLARQPNCLGDWVGISHSLVAGPDGVRWWWVCCVMGTNVVVWWLFLSGGRNTTEIQDYKRLNNTA